MFTQAASALLTQSTEGTASFMSMILPLVILIAVFYFLLIRPENKRKKEAENLRNSLKMGDEITTIGGITGTICAVKESTIVIESGADRVRLELTKWAVSTRNPAGKPAEQGK